MLELGWNYRIDEISCALGVSQISRLKRNKKKKKFSKNLSKITKK